MQFMLWPTPGSASSSRTLQQAARGNWLMSGSWTLPPLHVWLLLWPVKIIYLTVQSLSLVIRRCSAWPQLQTELLHVLMLLSGTSAQLEWGQATLRFRVKKISLLSHKNSLAALDVYLKWLSSCAAPKLTEYVKSGLHDFLSVSFWLELFPTDSVVTACPAWISYPGVLNVASVVHVGGEFITQFYGWWVKISCWCCLNTDQKLKVWLWTGWNVWDLKPSNDVTEQNNSRTFAC